jgi:hypothetical protein
MGQTDQRRLVPKLRGGVSWILSAGQMIELRVAAMRGVRVAHRRQLETYVSRRAVQTRGRRLRPPNRACFRYPRASSMSHENLGFGFLPEWCRTPRPGRRRKSPKTRW